MTFTEGYSLTVHYYVNNNSWSSSIKEHLEENKKNPLNLHCCCEIKLSHTNNVLGVFFCKQCNKSLCLECKALHQKEHLIEDNSIRNLIHCKEHDKPYVYYCYQCGSNLCMKCVLSHLKHEVCLIESNLHNIDVLSIKDKLQKAYNKIFLTNKDIYHNIISEINNDAVFPKETKDKHIQRITNSFNSNTETNKQILNFCLLLYINYNLIGNFNYESSSNFFFTSYINVDTLTLDKTESLLNRVELIENYFRKDLLFYSIEIENNQGEISFIKDIDTGKENSIMSMTVLSNHNLAVGSYKRLQIYKLPSFEQLMNISIHEDDIMHIRELKNHKIVTSSADNTINILSIDYENKSFICNQTITEHEGVVTKVIELENSNIASCSFDLTVKIYKYEENKQKYSIIMSIQAHSYWINEIFELPDRQLISVGGEFEPVMKFWTISSNYQYSLSHSIKGVFSTSPDTIIMVNSDFLLVGGGYGSIIGIRVSSYKIERVYSFVAKYVNMIYMLRDGTFIVHGSNDYCFRRGYVNTGKYQLLEDSFYNDESNTKGNKGRTIRLIKKIDKEHFITCSYEKSNLIRVWKF